MRLVTLSSGSSGNCYLLELNNRTIILDCGLSFEEITKNAEFPSFRNISFVFVSHSHHDHNKSMKNFARSGCTMLTYEMLEPKVQKHNIDSYEIITFPLAHNVQNYGIIIKCKEENENIVFCYCTDFYAIPKIEGVTHFLYEINYIEGYIDEMIDNNKELRGYGFNNHNSLEKAINYFSSLKTRPKQIICCHLSSVNAIADRILEKMKPFAHDVQVAKKGAIYGSWK